MAASQLLFGLTLFIDPAAIERLWPWPLSPATARLLASSTLVSVPLAVLAVAANRRSAARIPLIMLVAYRVIQLAAGALHLGRFDFSQPVTWNYFGAGGLMLVVMAAGLARTKSAGEPANQSHLPGWLRPDAPLRLPAAGRAWFRAFGALYVAVAVAFFGLGAQAAPLWFEPSGTLTPLTARLFASPALGLGLALLLIPRAQKWSEVGIPAVGMVTFGVAGSLAMLLAGDAIAPPSPLGWLVPVTPLVLLTCGTLLLWQPSSRPAGRP
jgi:hypothetical protein